MQKLFRVFYIIVLIFISGCIDPVSSNNSTDRAFKRVQSKYSYHIRPSESMSVGISKNHNGYKLREDSDHSQNNSAEDFYFTNDNEMLSTESKITHTIPGNDTNHIMEDGQYIGHYKIGKPYEIFGVSYTPQDYEDFEETGTASWYGDDFHGKPTANGEVYNMGEMTAAHPTLPLPSLVRVTNLRNNKVVIVRVNDRGPFAKNRVIDLSERAATLLGYKDQGTTEVKVELLKGATDQMLERLNISR